MAIPSPIALQNLPAGTQSQAFGISADGSVIVGASDFASGVLTRAVMWVRNISGGYDAPISLGTLPGGTRAVAQAISADGTTIVGQSDAADGFTYGFAWTSGGGMVQLPAGDDLFQGNAVFGCSADGSLIVGQAGFTDGLHAVCWSDVGWSVITSLDTPIGSTGAALGCDSSGTIVFGTWTGVDSINHGVRWVNGGGGFGAKISLGLFMGNEVLPAAMSADGGTIVGTGSDTGNAVAVLWTLADGWLNPIGLPAGAILANAISISPDATTVGGIYQPTLAGNGILLWTLGTSFLDVSGVFGNMQWFSEDNSVAVGYIIPFGTQAAYWQLASPPPPPPTPAVVIPESLSRWRGQVGINWNGLALVGDAFAGVVGLSNFKIFTEYGNQMRMLVTTPPLHDDRKRISVTRFEIEVESGDGEPGVPDKAPVMMFDYSKDGGVTWVDLQVFRSMGKVGEYIKRLRWINLGQSRTWVFRIQYTDSARPAIIGTYYSMYRNLG